MSLRIEKSRHAKAHVLRFCGQLDVLDSREIPGQLLPFTRRRLGTVVLDLSESSFIDSQWLAVFIRFHELSNLHKNKLWFCIPEGTVYDLFNATGLTKIFDVVHSLEEIEA